MTHFGLICPPVSSHLKTITALGHELQQRGHHITLFGVLDIQSKAQSAGLDFQAIAESEFPSGAMLELFAQMGKLTGKEALQYGFNLMQTLVTLWLQKSPKVLKQAGVEALLIDQLSLEGGTIADFLDIPFISVCNSLLLNEDYDLPPVFTHWRYQSVWWARLRNRACYKLFNGMERIKTLINQSRKEWNLPLYSSINDAFSQLAQLSQQPIEFEFPRTTLPQCFHFTGPYNNQASREPVAFPFEKLTGQPLIYASMGTLQNRQLEIFHKMAEACVGLDAQLVISLGGATNPESLSELPSSPLIVKYAPQLELLKKASLTITHAGLNTALESLSNGVPMVAIPITNDQPGVAVRITWTGVGEFIPVANLNSSKLRQVIKQVLNEDSYKQNAIRLQKAIRRAGGVTRAADIVEQAISTAKPVLSTSSFGLESLPYSEAYI
jgi:zeaxanthin glucosyltransferase